MERYAKSYLHSTCKERRINGDYAEVYVWESIRRKLQNIDELWEDLKAAQQNERKADEPKRAELEAVQEMIEEVDREIEEFTVISKAGGRVGETFQKKVDDANARYAAHVKRRDELTAELGANILTDDSIAEIMQFARDAREGIESATFEDKRRMLENLKVKITSKDAKVASIIGVIEICTPQNAKLNYTVSLIPRYFPVANDASILATIVSPRATTATKIATAS